MRGPLNQAKIQQAVNAIEADMADRNMEPAGDWRMLGYNSPMIPASNRYWEVQIPVQPAQ